jgi:hypothetical protein
MACIGGILMYVAFNMVKRGEVVEVLQHNRFHVGLMVYTAVMVIATGFLTGVLSAIILYAVLRRFLDRPVAPPHPHTPAGEAELLEETASSYGRVSVPGDDPPLNGQPAAVPAQPPPARIP